MRNRSLFLNAMSTNDARTENAMKTHSTSDSALVDFFGSAAGARKMREDQLITLFDRAVKEDMDKALKLLFWLRDVRGGAGERKAFRTCVDYLAEFYPEQLYKNVKYIPEFGRWDDILELLGTDLESAALRVIAYALRNEDSLCAKWMPRKGKVAAKLRAYLKLTPKAYRKLLVRLTNVVETPMCANEYSRIDYSKLPSLASARYQAAFSRNDAARYEAYKNALKKGEAKINASAIYPHDIVRSLLRGDASVADAQWAALPNYLEGSEYQRILPLVDTSGSMSVSVSGVVTAMDVAVGLGIYLSERNEGIFKDHFMTFSNQPTLQHLTGTLSSRARQLRTANWDFNTDLMLAFDTILTKAVQNRVPENHMPEVILVISDMQFDQCTRYNSNALEGIRRRYSNAGYVMPKVIFWNINGRAGQSPVKVRDNNTALISGFSPSIMKYVLAPGNLEKLTPYNMMLEVVNSPRYSVIAA